MYLKPIKNILATMLKDRWRTRSFSFIVVFLVLVFAMPVLAAGSESVSVPLYSDMVLICIMGVIILALVISNLLFLFWYSKLMRMKKAVIHLPIQSGVCDIDENLLFYQDQNNKNHPENIKGMPTEFQKILHEHIQSVFKSQQASTDQVDMFGTCYKFDFKLLAPEIYGKQTVMWIYYDITDQKKLLEEKQRMWELIRNTLSSIGDAVISTNYDGFISLVNRAAVQLLNNIEGNLVGKKFEDYIKICDDNNV